VKSITVSLLAGIATFVVVFGIARKQPIFFGLTFGVINALVVFAAFSIAKASNISN
jgi:hypothetical protein